MARKIIILNGPNLTLLGKRQPDIYGHETLDDAVRNCIKLGNKLDLELEFFQSNSEGEIVDIISRISKKAAGIIINPAAYSHTSVAILDALKVYTGPVLEVHISNIHKREEFRRHSFVSLRADGVIAGFGIQGYELALQRMARILS